MAREPEMTTPPERGERKRDTISQVRHYRLIAPLFGGGVETKQADPISTVRASEVRGQLRFWWRATRGGQFANLAAMKQAEGELWGSTSEPSEVQVVVTLNNSGDAIDSFPMPDGSEVGIGKPQSPISYATFALRDAGSLRLGVEFTLTLSFPKKQQEEVEASLWAWETFGGIGARTRRGFGALCCLSYTQDGVPMVVDRPETRTAESVKAWLNKHMEVFSNIVDTRPQVPSIIGSQIEVARNAQDFTGMVTREGRKIAFTTIAKVLLDQAPSVKPNKAEYIAALTAWYYPIDMLKKFRQSRTNSRGRSFWPEPDAIRYRMKNGFQGKHKDPIEKTRSIRKFPRAVFGLPIIFEFKDKVIDPPTVTLQGNSYKRMASPLILRPLRCADNTYASIAVVLNVQRELPGGLSLVVSNRDAHLFDENAGAISTEPLTDDEAKNIIPLKGEPDVLLAFLKML